MDIKTCSNCLKELFVENFAKNKEVCKKCAKRIGQRLWREKNKDSCKQKTRLYRMQNRDKLLETRREYKKINKERIREKRSEYYETNKEKISEKNSEYKEKNKEKTLETRRQLYIKTKEKSNEQSRAYYVENKENLKEWRKKYNQENKEKIQSRLKTYRAEKRKTDPSYKISCVMSNAIWSALKVKKSSKNGCSWEKLLGYTRDDLKIHLESKFTSEMAWENYGSYWHIDHIIPKSWFYYSCAEDENFKTCWALSNLQPLSVKENLSKNNRWAG